MQLRLEQTCGACPEQYDAYLGDEKVGYLRLRHRYFRAECKGQVVYEGEPRGDGCFQCDERDFYLNEACRAIVEHLQDHEERYYTF